MKNKFVKLLAISAVIFGSVSCKDEVAAIGQKAPDIAAYDLQGKEVKLEDWKGTRLLTFWSETCGRCVAELKEFEKLNYQMSEIFDDIEYYDENDADISYSAEDMIKKLSGSN